MILKKVIGQVKQNELLFNVIGWKLKLVIERFKKISTNHFDPNEFCLVNVLLRFSKCIEINFGAISSALQKASNWNQSEWTRAIQSHSKIGFRIILNQSKKSFESCLIQIGGKSIPNFSPMNPNQVISTLYTWISEIVTDYISENISTDESVPCFDFTEESVNASREHNFWIREFKIFIYSLLIYRPLKIIIITSFCFSAVEPKINEFIDC